MKARVWFEGDLCIVALLDKGRVIWSDYSGPGAWPGLVAAGHQVAKAAQIMVAKGQHFEEWRVIVDRAPRL